MLINASDLKVGDFLPLRDKTYKFYRHIAVVTYVDKQEGIYKVIHWRGTGEPFAITEATLPSAESLAERNIEFECFRLNDQEQALTAIKILQQWLSWAVPYDKDRFLKAEVSINKFFSISSDFWNDKLPKIDKEQFSKKLEPHRKEMERLFIENYMDVVKYAARRDITPVRPKPDGEKQTGFHCLQGILIAFQVSYAENFVNSVTDQWLSNKHVKTNTSLKDTEPRFESAKKALKENFNQQEFLASFPLAFKLQAKSCSIDTFVHAMLSDDKNITYIGVLNTPKEAEIKPDKETMIQNCLIFKNKSKLKRDELMQKIAISSMKSFQYISKKIGHVSVEVDSNFITINTGRLTLKSLNQNYPSLISNYSKLLGNSHNVKLLNDGEVWSDEQVKTLIEVKTEAWNKGDPFGVFSIYDRKTVDFLGSVNIKKELDSYKETGAGHKNVIEIGFIIDNAFWNKGYATEAAIMAKKYIKHAVSIIAKKTEEVLPQEIVATVHPENKYSLKILQKILKKVEPDPISKFNGQPRLFFFKPLKPVIIPNLEPTNLSSITITTSC